MSYKPLVHRIMSSVTKFPPTASASSTDSRFLFAPTVKKILPFILSALALMSLSSCRGDRRVDDVLDVADTLMFVKPDSAVTMLENIARGRESSEQTARGAMLLAKAREKADIYVQDSDVDSSLSRSIAALDFAAERFRGRGDSLEVQTLFYRGVLLGYRGDYSDALVSFMEAADRASDIGDNFYFAMASREQAEIYTRLYEFDRAAYLGKIAVDNFTLCNHLRHAAWAQVFNVQALAYSDKIIEACDLIESLKNDSIINNDPYLKQHFYSIASSVFYNHNDLEKSEDYFNKYIESGGRPSSKMLSQMAGVKLRNNKLAEAQYLFDLALDSRQSQADSLAADYVLADFYVRDLDYKSAYSLQKALGSKASLRANRLITHPYTAAISSFYRSETRRQSVQLKDASLRLILMCSISMSLLVIGILVVIAHRRKIQRNNIEYDLLLSDMSRLKVQLEAKNFRRNNCDSEKLLPITLLNSICELRGLMLPTDDGLKRFGKNISKILETFVDSENMKLLEVFVDRMYDNLMNRFRQQMSGLTEREFKVSVLVFSGFSDSSIAAMLKCNSISGMRQIRYKIRQKIKSCNAPDGDEFSSYFLTYK